jgi:N-acetylneuraminic acid mutarotase
MLVHGGEAYNRMMPTNADIRSDVIGYDRVKHNWIRITTSAPALAGHQLQLIDNGDVYLFGGVNGQLSANRNTYRLMRM